ncbi:hypothetical protein IFM89_016589 [Coptis chinensis]|uniref:Pentatricopeptide repeat-containing protein n=1 Tax=Coptis chinensis TaxID=261450 RepID=A0A835LV96_9MAGN|nr:hypothetical protein IFM89_016589 [Coptis chinensis]
MLRATVCFNGVANSGPSSVTISGTPNKQRTYHTPVKKWGSPMRRPWTGTGLLSTPVSDKSAGKRPEIRTGSTEEREASVSELRTDRTVCETELSVTVGNSNVDGPLPLDPVQRWDGQYLGHELGPKGLCLDKGGESEAHGKSIVVWTPGLERCNLLDYYHFRVRHQLQCNFSFVDPFVLALAFKACGCDYELNYGKMVHGYTVKNGFANNVFVGSSLLDMYTKCECVEMGCRVFDEMPERNVVSWTVIITGLVRCGCYKEALMYFSEMWGSDVQCDSYTFASALKACADSCDLKSGKAIHTQAMKAGFDTSSFVANTLTNMYAKCGELDYGVRLFERMKIHDVVLYTMIISSYVQIGREELAVQTFVRMRESGVCPNEFTFASIISACANLARVYWGEQLHLPVIHIGLGNSLSVANAIMTMYSKCGRVRSSSMVFDGMVRRDTVSWTTIIVGYSQDGHCEEAFDYYSRMRRGTETE